MQMQLKQKNQNKTKQNNLNQCPSLMRKLKSIITQEKNWRISKLKCLINVNDYYSVMMTWLIIMIIY